MKGKLLTYEEIVKLPHGTKVLVEDNISNEVGYINQDCKWVSGKNIDQNAWHFRTLNNINEVEENDIQIYLWEDKPMKAIGNVRFQRSTEGMTKEQMIRLLEDSSDCPKAYGLKDSEGCNVSCDVCARQAIENAINRHPEEDVPSEVEVIPAYIGSRIIEMIESGQIQSHDILLDKNENEHLISNITVKSIINLSPFTIKKEEPISFMEAAQGYENGTTICCTYNDNKYEYVPNICNTYKRIEDEHGYAISSNEILEGKWFIKS